MRPSSARNPLRPRLPLLPLLLLLAGPVLLAGRAGAAEYFLNPSVTARETYDSNVFFMGSSDFETRVSPGLVARAASERGQATLSGVADAYHYLDRDSYDRINQTYSLASAYNLSERLGLTFNSSYTRDFTFDDALSQYGVVTAKNMRTNYLFQPGFTQALTPRDSVQASYRFSRVDYSSDLYADDTVHGGTLAYSHLLGNERTKLFTSLDFNRVATDGAGGEGTQAIWQMLAGVEHRFSELFTISGAGGAGYTDSSFGFSRGGDRLDSRDWTYLASLDLKWAWERYSLRLGASRDITYGLYGESVSRNKYIADASYHFTERLAAGLYSAYAQSKSEGLALTRQDSDWLSVTPNLRYKLAEDYSMSLGYSHSTNSDKVANTVRDREQVFVEVQFAFPTQY
jgi:hypothetical protein